MYDSKHRPSTANLPGNNQSGNTQIQANSKTFDLLIPSKQDSEFVVNLFNQSPSENLTINTIHVISAQVPEYKFTQHINQLSQQYNISMDWKNESRSDVEKHWRQHIYQMSQTLAQAFANPNYPGVNFGFHWHGTKEDRVNSIIESGFEFRGETDPGFFGQGVYVTSNANYASDTYAKPDGVLFVVHTAYRNVFPVVLEDMNDIIGKPNIAKKYDAHFIPVVPLNPTNPLETRFIPTKPGQEHIFTEITFFPSNGYYPVKPAFLITLQPLLPKSPAISPFIAAMNLYQAGLVYKKNGDHERATWAFEISATENFMPAVAELSDERLIKKAETDNDRTRLDYSFDIANRLEKLYQQRKSEEQYFYRYLAIERQHPTAVADIKIPDLVETGHENTSQDPVSNIPEDDTEAIIIFTPKTTLHISGIKTQLLIEACIQENKNHIYKILSSGASLTKPDANGYTAIGYLTMKENKAPDLTILQTVVDFYKTKYKKQFPIDILQGSEFISSTPLSFACQKNWIEAATFYLALGADPRAIRTTDCLTSLDICAYKNHIELFDLLLTKSHFSLEAANLRKSYLIAKNNNNTKVVKLIEIYCRIHRLDISTKEEQCIIPIGTSLEVLSRMISKGSPINSNNNEEILTKLNNIIPGWQIHSNGKTVWLNFNVHDKLSAEALLAHFNKHGYDKTSISLKELNATNGFLLVLTDLSFQKIKNIPIFPTHTPTNISNNNFKHS